MANALFEWHFSATHHKYRFGLFYCWRSGVDYLDLLDNRDLNAPTLASKSKLRFL